MKTLFTNGPSSSPQMRRSTSFIGRARRGACGRTASTAGLDTVLFAEVVLSGVWIIRELGRIACGAYLAVGDDIGAFGDFQRGLDIMVGNQDSDILLFELAYDLLDIL